MKRGCGALLLGYSVKYALKFRKEHHPARIWSLHVCSIGSLACASALYIIQPGGTSLHCCCIRHGHMHVLRDPHVSCQSCYLCWDVFMVKKAASVLVLVHPVLMPQAFSVAHQTHVITSANSEENAGPVFNIMDWLVQWASWIGGKTSRCGVCSSCLLWRELWKLDETGGRVLQRVPRETSLCAGLFFACYKTKEKQKWLSWRN